MYAMCDGMCMQVCAMQVSMHRYGMLCRYLCALYDALRICAMRDGQAGRSAGTRYALQDMRYVIRYAK